MHNTERFRNRFIENTVRLCVDIPPAQVATCITCVTYLSLHICFTSMVTSIIRTQAYIEHTYIAYFKAICSVRSLFYSTI